MLFHTWPFLVFFLVVYSIFLILRNTSFRIHWLLVASYFFYGWWNPLYLPLIVFSTLVDYWAVNLMERTGRRRLWLVVSLVNNLGLLAFFKYADFAVNSFNWVFGTSIGAIDLPLPIGISFYTFQILSYTIDVYRGKAAPERDPVVFATYVAYFPQLVAGPIERAARLLPRRQRLPALSPARDASTKRAAAGRFVCLLWLVGLALPQPHLDFHHR